MSVTRVQVESTVRSVIDELNEARADGERIGTEPATVLYGSGSVLDSLGLVNLIVSIEARVGEDFGESVTLADEKAMSMRNSPFRTVATITEYVHQLLTEQAP